ncbi:hypothetical protein LCGC14_0804000 [marine sediment metagenome]|uniref:Fumarylacetoacetase-like C-terminal domain-containing protein n=1 Tax=marine sediment metagenome TaxID=412755 RepID=A0A0F9Q8L3_9ZZZZ
MEQKRIQELGDELYQAMLALEAVDPLTGRGEDISINDAYHISLRMLERRLAAGASVVGKKIGVTSKAVQNMLNVHQPDFGYLTDDMVFNSGEVVPISDRLIVPRAEGEIAFIQKKDLIGPGVTNADVLAATECMMPCFEIVDSRIRDWKIAIQDTIADNASCGLFVLGDQAVSPRKVDLVTCGMVVEKNGAYQCRCWSCRLGVSGELRYLAGQHAGEFGIPLKAGEVILSGSLVPLEPVSAGDYMRVDIGGVGSASVRFA